MSIPPSTLVHMGYCNCKSLGFIENGLFPWILKVWFMVLALFAKVTLEDKVETPSSADIFCISDCATCPVICSPPPPPSPSVPVPHSPQSPFYFTFSPPPLPKSQSPPTPSSHSAPPPPSKPYKYNTPPSPSSSSSSQPQPTVISGPHDYYYPYYYFYASSSPSLSIHAPFLVLLSFLIGYSFVGNM